MGLSFKDNKILLRTLCILLVAFGVLLTAYVLLPHPVQARFCEERRYVCTFEDGTQAEVSFSDAIGEIAGIEKTAVLLRRFGKIGRVSGSEQFCACSEGLFSGEATLLFAARGERLDALERLALMARFDKTGYYAGGFFVWNGERVLPAEAGSFEEVYLLDGALPAGLLAKTNAKKLILKTDADLRASALSGSEIETIEAEPPFLAEGGAVYQVSFGKRRLIAALPNAEELSLDFDYFEKGALSPCTGLKKLTLPSGFDGTLRMLFGNTPFEEVEYEIL